MKLKEIFEKTVKFFKDKNIESARLDAEILISHALKIQRIQLYLKYEQPLSELEISKCREYVKRRAAGEPVAYIIEEKGFFGETFYVGPGVLIPRPETETLVEEAISSIQDLCLKEIKVLDIGAGTGCIGFSILKELLKSTSVDLTSVEKSDEAFVYLKRNSIALSLQSHVRLIQTDIENVIFNENEKFDLIVANPPYIDFNDKHIEENVKKYEPSMALFSEQNGLYAIKKWLEISSSILKNKGIIFFEIGYQQAADVLSIASSLNIFSEIKVIKDLSGLDRILKCVR